MKRLTALILVLMLAAGIALAETAPTQEPAATAAPTAVPVPADAVVMTVNGTSFTQAQLDDARLAVSGMLYNSPTLVEDPAVTQEALEMLIVEEFTNAMVAQYKLESTEEEIAQLEAQLENEIIGLAAQLLQQGYVQTEEESLQEARQYAQDQGYTLEYLKEVQRYEKLMTVLTQGVTVTDQEVLDVFNERVAQETQIYSGEGGLANYGMMEYYSKHYFQQPFDPYYIPEGIRVINHILLEADAELMQQYNEMLPQLEEAQDAEDKAAEGEEADAPKVTQADLDAMEEKIIASVQETITEIMTKLDNGVAFYDLVKEYSMDSGASAEGYQVHKEANFVDAFRIGSFELLEKVGDVSVPVVSEYGVHILYFQDEMKSGPVELDDARKAAIHSELLGAKEQDAANGKLNDWKNAADIQLFHGYTLTAE